MDANFGLVHKRNSGDGHGRHNSRHKDVFFLNHLELKKFKDDYAADTKSLKNVCKYNYKFSCLPSIQTTITCITA